MDYIEPGQPKKAPFVLRTDDQLSMFFKSESKSILLRVIQRIVQFEKGSKWAVAYYTHPASYYKLPSTSAVTLPKISIPKPSVLQVLTRNEETLMRSWAKKHGKSVRQRNVRQNNTKDRAGTLPLNLYESETILNPLNLQLM